MKVWRGREGGIIFPSSEPMCRVQKNWLKISLLEKDPKFFVCPGGRGAPPGKRERGPYRENVVPVILR